VLNQQVRDEANHINRLLSRRGWVGNRKERRGLLTEATDASIRGLTALANEPLITETRAYLDQSFERLGGNPAAFTEELRHDALLLQMFISAEERLLRDMGVDASAVQRIAESLVATIFSEDGDSEPETDLEERLRALIGELQTDLAALQRDAQRAGTAARVAAALGGLGGALVVAVDGAATVASHGLAFGAGQASISLGAGMIGKALDDALS